MQDFDIKAQERAIAEKLKNLRVRACISLDEFAEALGVETHELEAYENCSEDVPASVIAMACALSGTPYEYFFGEEENYDPVMNHINITKEQVAVLN